MKLVLEKLKLFEHIIWDWNGTLVADTQVSVNILSELLSGHGLPGISSEEYRNNFSFPIRSYYQKLGLPTEEPLYKQHSHYYQTQYRENYREAKLFHGTEELFDQLIGDGKTLSILSLSEQLHLEEAVSHFGLDKYVTHIFGLHNHLAESKAQRGRELLKASGCDRKNTILVGDTAYDAEVAAELEISVLLLADGYQSYEQLCKLTCPVLPTRYM
jgi:phosphoglycolate phosphatase